MNRELILSVTQHRKFGVLFVPFIITKTDGNAFYTSIEKANSINIKEVSNYRDDFMPLIQLIHEYDDAHIANYYTKKKEDAVEFLKHVSQEFIDERIRPYIERRLLKIGKMLPKLGIELFFKDKKYTKIYESDKIYIAPVLAEAVFHFTRNPEGITYTLSLLNGAQKIRLKNKKNVILTESPCMLIIDNMLHRFTNIDSKKLLPFFTKEQIQINKSSEKVYFEKFVASAIKEHKVEANGFTINYLKEKPGAQLYIQNDLQGTPTLLLKFAYADKLILPNNKEMEFVSLNTAKDNYVFTKISRSTKAENNTTNELKDFGLNSSDGIHFYPNLNNETEPLYELINWVNSNYDELKEAGILVKQEFFNNKYLLNPLSLELSVDDTKDWFDIKGKVKLGEFYIPFLKLRKYIIQDKREYPLPDGSIAILPEEWFAKYKELMLFSSDEEDSLRLNKMHFNLLNDKLVGIDNSYAKGLEQLYEHKSKEELPLPSGLKANLRPYQQEGYLWMNRLKEHQFGGCLADDMGLGKTLQTLTLLLENSKEELAPQEETSEAETDLFSSQGQNIGITKRPVSLIVMPSSLIHNWANEIQKFTPELRVFKHLGYKRSGNFKQFSSFDLILTTYGVVRNDVNAFSKFEFSYIILDESQVIKNPDSKIYKAITQLQSKHKLVLTGTPIENSLTDLWSQINFVNRGLLGNYNFFKKEFVTPIEKFSDEQKSEKLQQLIHPFILRRTKDQVAKDLPPRTEQIRYCDMSEDQAKIYEEEKSAVRNNILEKMEGGSTENSSMMVLAALTRLRQLANHPSLLDFEADSGKFDEVTRILNNIVAEKHKVLIFSSFVQHLNMYEQYLEEQGIGFSKLTGETRNRQEVINDFQTKEEKQVFLISLKAGGVGLNLTAADYVFLLDPWWNPAAENQAINRAHRIGQDKKVFVYKFISSNSIEEKIVKLQTKKSELAGLFVNTNNPFKDLNTKNVQELFE